MYLGLEKIYFIHSFQLHIMGRVHVCPSLVVENELYRVGCTGGGGVYRERRRVAEVRLWSHWKGT